MRRRDLFAPVLMVAFASVVPGATEGSARADAGELDRLMARADAEEQGIKGELAAIGPKLDLTRRRIVARGRAYYRLVHAGLLPAGGGFDALVDHAAHVERSRRALERDVAAEATLTRRASEIEARL